MGYSLSQGDNLMETVCLVQRMRKCHHLQETGIRNSFTAVTRGNDAIEMRVQKMLAIIASSCIYVSLSSPLS